MTRAKKVTKVKNHFFHARQPRKEILEICSCCGLIFMAVFGSFGPFVLTH